MAQTIATVAFEALPTTVTLLEKAITAFRRMQEPDDGPAYMDLSRNLPTLHFMSIMVFRDSTYDPLFLMEVNFDGDPREFWKALCRIAGKPIIDIMRYCAPPRDAGAAQAFADMLATGDGLPGVLAAAAVHPTASHLGNRGLPRTQIEAEAALFDRAQQALNAGDAAYRAQAPADIHKTLRGSVLADFAWLDTPSPPRITREENIADWRNLIVFASLALAVLAVPGTIAALVLPWWFVAVLAIAGAFAVWNHVPNIAALIPSAPGEILVVVAIAVLSCIFAVFWLGLASAGLLVLLAIAEQIRHSHAPGLAAWAAGTFRCIVAGGAAAPATVLFILIALRRLEIHDPTSTDPAMSDALASSLAAREDKTQSVYQNHMGSMVMVKAGGLRSLLLRVGHHALHLILRIVARDGYLSDMRTVHFAHWALMNNNSRLLFMSNFDGTWDSYLDDFIEKASTGTTLAWTNCTGSPLAAFLVLQGVTKGRQFKAWARASMAPNLFWFSAYPTLTVNQIERNHIIAEGLRAPSLDAGKAAQWIRAL